MSFSLRIMAKLLCSSLRVSGANVELHAMDENLFNDCLIGK